MLHVVKRSEDELADFLATEAGFIEGLCRFDDAPINLDPWQRFFLTKPGRWRCLAGARQIGKSLMFAMEAFARSHLKIGHNSVFVSYNLEDAKEKIRYVDQLHEELPLAYKKRRVVDSKTEIAFESNGTHKRISRIISHPCRAPRGKKGDLYLDELAHYGEDRTVYSGSTSLILRTKAQITIGSTPLGRRGIFWEIAEEPIKRFRAYRRQVVPWWLCSYFCTDPVAAAKYAPRMPTEERVETYGTNDIKDQLDSLDLEDFQQEFEVTYVDESYSFFPYKLIIPCTRDFDDPDSGYEPMAEDFDALGDVKGRLVAGFDVGRRKDLSELAIFEDIDGKKRARLFRRYDRVSFSDQENDLRRMLNHLPIARLWIDESGIGMHLAENLINEFPEQVIGVPFSNQRKEVMAIDFKIGLQRKDLLLPKDREIIAQVHSIKKKFTPGGAAKFDSEKGGAADFKGHADRFWACALACQKERGPMPEDAAEVDVTIVSC